MVLKSAHPLQIIFAGEAAALAAMVDMLVVTAYTEVAVYKAAAFEKAIIGTVPTTSAQRRFFYYSFGAFAFAYPPLTPIPLN